MSDRSTLVVSARSWHGRLYTWWRAQGGFKTIGYRENLCHYWRVVAIWAPLKFFLVNSSNDRPSRDKPPSLTKR